MIHHPSRGADDDVNAAFKGGDLSFYVLSAVNREDSYVIAVFQKPVELFGNLNRKFACRRKNNCLNVTLVRFYLLYYRNRKCRSLSGSRLSLTCYVTPLHD